MTVTAVNSIVATEIAHRRHAELIAEAELVRRARLARAGRRRPTRRG